MASVARAAAALPVDAAWLDGEVVVMQATGRSSFQALQNALSGDEAAPLTYVVFDAPFLDGRDLRKLPLVARKQALHALIARAGEQDVVRYADHIEGDGAAFFAQAIKHGVEGIVSKRRDAPYESRRTTTWRKARGEQRQEFVIGGWTPPPAVASGLGRLLIGVRDGDALKFVGRVGTGFSDRLLRELRAKLESMEQKSSPFVKGTIAPPKGSRFVRPELVAEVGFTEWTDDGQLRHPDVPRAARGQGREDVVRETPMASAKPNRSESGEGRDARRRRASSRIPTACSGPRSA
jgi:bifunctional non-homologous end joining protein LigD